MSANSDTIRISVDLPREMYFAMHSETERNGQTHAGFARVAIEDKLRKAEVESNPPKRVNTQK